ncbi:LAMI_0H16490g1_1 [Lachancea mirantina]|uniref:LAMI_0H16490g1_1 n=1 Tax=Lachancea mirantina TaxID=1230905 RepID=A0A1G4KIU5_9SACH|nr:LAMI_0H16490g1_1 [Lachancea mirantina]
MRGQRIESTEICENARLEIAFERNPFFAGEPIQLGLRIKHLGSSHELERLRADIEICKKQIEELEHRDATEGKKWGLSALLGTFGNDKRAEKEKIEQQITKLEQQMLFHEPIQLVSCYIQLYGMFRYDKLIVSRERLENGGRQVAGVRTIDDMTNNSVSHTLVGLLNVTLDDVSKSFIGEQEVEMAKMPFLLVPQTLVFSELCLMPEETKTFQFRSPRLPHDLPPSYYSSKHLNIEYFCDMGLARVKQGTVSPFKTEFTINICPFVDSLGRQFTSTLDRNANILPCGRVKEITEASQSRRKSGASLFVRRRSSLLSLNQQDTHNEDSAKAKSVFRTSIDEGFMNEGEGPELEQMVDKVLDAQFGPQEFEDLSDDEPSEVSNLAILKGDPRINIGKLNSYIQSLPSSLNDDESTDAQPNLMSQFKNCQKEYIINRNGEFIAKVNLSKYFYDTSEDLDLCVELCQRGKHKVTAVSIKLECFELVNPRYRAEGEDLNTRPEGSSIYEKRTICFENSPQIFFKLIPPRSPSNQMTSQFRTDIFQLRWMLCIKFVVLDRTENEVMLEQFYEDKNGALFHAKKNVDGVDFVCHVPVVILPTPKEFGGW